MQVEIKRFESVFFRYLMTAAALAMFVAIGVYAYLGTFSRHLSDDYCEAVRANRSNPISAVIERYTDGQWRAANRYSNLMFVGFGELLGENNLPITTVAMVILLPIGLSWSVYEFRRFFKVQWPLQTDCFLGATLGFFIMLQAPNLFQSIYWRSSMMTHFAPIVFGSYLFAFWMRQAARAGEQKISLLIYLLILFFTYVIAGFSEPPVATMVTTLALIIGAVWFWGPVSTRKRLLPLLSAAFLGAFLGLLTMVFSPANRSLAQDSPGVINVLKDSFEFSFIFVVYAFKMLPLPGLLSALIPALIACLYKQSSPSILSSEQKRSLWTIAAAAPILLWILIAAGFSPSVYGQGYPVERMRFLASSLMTATFMIEGGILGLLVGTSRPRFNLVLSWAAVILFILTGVLYPLRAALRVYRSLVPEYQTRAEMWDLRDAYILRHAGLGEMDIVVPGYSAVYNIKEFDDDPGHWVNSCAADYYGVRSIRAVTMPDEYILGYLSE
jgi:hypothetical protein